MSTEKGKRLGRGLDALIPSASTGRDQSNELRRIPLSKIRPNQFQPRREFAEEELSELQASIKASGLLQPVSVRPAGDGFELISGERRLRAVTRLGWEEVPAIIKNIDDRMMLTLAMIENLQRADLNPIEEANGYRSLIDEFGLTQQEVAHAIGKDRTTITGLLRILNLPREILGLVEEGKLTVGHAKALLVLESSSAIIRLGLETVSRHYSVRELERRVREAVSPSAPQPRAGDAPSRDRQAQPPGTRDSAVKSVEDRLRRRLQTDVKVRLTDASRGTLEVGFYSADDLERLLELMGAHE